MWRTKSKFACARLHSRTLRVRLLAFLPLVSLSGCHSVTPRQPSGIPPTATSINREQPGGDAADPHQAALKRLLEEPWGWRNDKQDALHVPLPDWGNWRRIRYYGVPSFVGFRYGDDHHAVIAIWVREVDEGTTLAQCLDEHEKWGEPFAQTFGVRVEQGPAVMSPWSPQPGPKPEGPLEIVTRSLDAEMDTIFARGTYYAAYTAYAMWPKTCTIFGFAVAVRGAPELARQVRERYVTDGFWRLERHSAAVPAL